MICNAPKPLEELETISKMRSTKTIIEWYFKGDCGWSMPEEHYKKPYTVKVYYRSINKHLIVSCEKCFANPCCIGYIELSIHEIFVLHCLLCQH